MQNIKKNNIAHKSAFLATGITDFFKKKAENQFRFSQKTVELDFC